MIHQQVCTVSSKLDHVYLRHLSAECRSILSADVATDTRPIYRPTLDRHSADMSAECRSSVGRHEPTSMSADTRPILHRHWAATRPPLGRHSAATRPILYQHSANTKLTWSALGTEIFPALLREAFSGRRPFLAFNSGNIFFFQLCLFLVIAFIYDTLLLYDAAAFGDCCFWRLLILGSRVLPYVLSYVFDLNIDHWETNML